MSRKATSKPKQPKVQPTYAWFVVHYEGEPFLATAGSTANEAMYNCVPVFGEKFEALEERHGYTVRRLLISEPPKRKGKR